MTAKKMLDVSRLKEFFMKSRIRSCVLILVLAAVTTLNIAPIASSQAVRAATGTVYEAHREGTALPIIANGRIAYSSRKVVNNSDTCTIHAIDPDGSNHVQLTSGPRDFTPGWSPDGS